MLALVGGYLCGIVYDDTIIRAQDQYNDPIGAGVLFSKCLAKILFVVWHCVDVKWRQLIVPPVLVWPNPVALLSRLR